MSGISSKEAHRRLLELAGPQDEEIAHQAADEILLKCIEGLKSPWAADIREAFAEIDKWYA